MFMDSCWSCDLFVFFFFFFFKQKTAYEMRISDWSSDVCSSDLLMCGFILWSNERLAEYAKINPAAFFTGIRTTWDRHGGRPKLHDHEAYDNWLQNRKSDVDKTQIPPS